MKNLIFIFFCVAILLACGEENQEVPDPGTMQLSALRIGTKNLLNNDITEIKTDQPVVATFTAPLDLTSIENGISLNTTENNEEVEFTIAFLDENRSVSLSFIEALEEGIEYTLVLSDQLKGESGQLFEGISINFSTESTPISVVEVLVDNNLISKSARNLDISLSPEIVISFSKPIEQSVISNKAFLQSSTGATFSTLSQVADSILSFKFSDLKSYTKHSFFLVPGIEYGGSELTPYSFDFYTKLDSTLKFPEISDEELLTKVQEQTFKYFYDFGHPVSGLSRERNTSDDNVTIGGSGFGVMSIIVGIERGFITRQEGIERLEKITDFLETKAERFHGAWSHWLSGTTGKVIPFSADDDGGDLVETAFMIQGLITVRQYLDIDVVEEKTIIDRINRLVDEVEWDWYQQGGQNQLYWQWSPNFGWQKNLAISGWNEALIIYLLAASSNTYSIEKEVYDIGWARNGAMVNTGNNTFYGYTLPLRSDMGGPLFFAHYSFLGLDPRNLSDTYATYWDQNVIHTQINRAYCVDNPQNNLAYSENSWGLTASDGNNGYSAHSPNNDRGVITPTAALSSIPYTPEESMQALKFFYYIMGDKLWGEYGFYDAFNATEGWYATSYLAIDQGPIIIMIENYRTGLLWDLFMSAPEVQGGLDKLDFTYE